MEQFKKSEDPVQRKWRLPKSRIGKIGLIVAGVLLLFAIISGIILTSYPNAIIHYVIEPKLKQLVIDRLGRRYSLQMNSIDFSKNKDSLILTGVRISDNRKTDDGSTDTSAQNFGVATPLNRFTTDTIMIAGLDYWKLIFQKGLFADKITIRSPKIYLRPGSLPKFAENSDLLPSFLPAVSSRTIEIENAEIHFSGRKRVSSVNTNEQDKNGFPPATSAVSVKHASIQFHDFFLDETTYKKAVSTFFCKNATFQAEDISHVDSLGVTDISVVKVEGNLIDSSMIVYSLVSTKPIEEVQYIRIKHIDFAGLDWYGALAGHGLHGKRVVVETPQIDLQNVEQMSSYPIRRIAGSDLIPLPSLLPNVLFDHFEVRNAEVYTMLPKSHNTSSLKHIRLTLEGFRIDSSSPFKNISMFFSKTAHYGIQDESLLNTSVGTMRIGPITGTEKSVSVSDIRLKPTIKGVNLVRVRSLEILGVDIWKILMRDGFFATSISVHQPSVYLNESLTPPIASIDSALCSDPLALIRSVREYPLPQGMPVARIGTITVAGGSIHGIHFFDNPKNPPGVGDSLFGLGLFLNNFKLDNNSWLRNRGMLFSDACNFSVGALTQHTQGANYSYTEGGIRGDLRKHTLIIDSLVMSPLIPEDSYGAAFEFRTERISFLAPKVVVAGINYRKLFSGSGIFADSISLSNWNTHIYGDRRRPEEIRIKSSLYPHERFQQIKVPIDIKNVVLLDGALRFRESWPDTTFPGTIPFDHINLRIGEISNDRKIKNDSTPTYIKGDLRIMNAGLINFSIGYQLLNPLLVLNIQGALGSIDASLFNEYLERTEPFTLTGLVRSADFSLQLRGNLMTGVITPQYDSLHVKFFRWDKFPPGFVSFLANALFMRSHNIPELDHPLHRAEISAVIEQNVSLFWGLWLPIRNGIGSVVRIPEWVW